MSNILLIEPDYRSKFPPLGLMRISTYHRGLGDSITFARGKVPWLRNARWHRVYVSSLFTYELPRTVSTIKYYLRSVPNPNDIVVGGIGATLLPNYIKDQVDCTVIEGALDKKDMLGPGSPAIANLIPDYDLIKSVPWEYSPSDAYFCRLTVGCIRRCKFCAVPILEPTFGLGPNLHRQVREVIKLYGERQNLVLLDNNVLAIEGLEGIIKGIRDEGFEPGARLGNRLRKVDFNQGIDARLITKKTAALLASIPLSPVRLAFDSEAIEPSYRRAISFLAKAGFGSFTNYVMFNFTDTPQSFYHRLSVNTELSSKLGIKITGFPMKYVPIGDVNRRHISTKWKWRYLRGIQCVLLATHGMVSPNPEFFQAAFGRTFEEFIEILSMPDRYIIHRSQYQDKEASAWKRLWRALSPNDKEEFLGILQTLNKCNNLKQEIYRNRRFGALLEHYYPGGSVPRDEPAQKNQIHFDLSNSEG